MKAVANLISLWFCLILPAVPTCMAEILDDAGVPKTTAASPLSIKLIQSLLTVEVKEAPLQEILDAVAYQSGVKIFLSSDTHERVTLEFHNLPLEEGLCRILRGKNFLFFYSRMLGSGHQIPVARLAEVHVLPSVGNENGTPQQSISPVTESTENEQDEEPVGQVTQVLLEGDRPELRQGAAKALGRMRSAETIVPLGQAVEDEDDPMVRESVVEALGKTWHEDSVDPLAGALLGDEDAVVREAAARALGKTWSEGAVQPLVQALLEDPNHSVRENAARTLGQIGDPSAVPSLTIATDDADVAVREGARQALEAIGDQ